MERIKIGISFSILNSIIIYYCKGDEVQKNDKGFEGVFLKNCKVTSSTERKSEMEFHDLYHQKLSIPPQIIR